jgi:hypothetical protein
MQTIEFEYVIDNGIITIPEKFKSMTTNGAKVQIFIKPVPLQKTDLFPFAGIDMSEYIFNREEANE